MAESIEKESEDSIDTSEQDYSMPSWISGWFQAAKDKSMEVLDFVKKDLGEFSEAFQKETNYVVTSTTNKLKEKLSLDDEDSPANSVKRSVSSLLGQVTNAFTLLPDDSGTETIVMKNNQPIIMDRVEAQLYSVRQDIKTYTCDPDDFELFVAFVKASSLEEKKAEFDDILIKYPEVKAHFDTLVPNKVAHDEFWCRYLFQVKKVYDDHLQRQMLADRAEKHIDQSLWDEDDMKPEMEISEEIQTKLLEAYEKECCEVNEISEILNVESNEAQQVKSASFSEDTNRAPQSMTQSGIVEKGSGNPDSSASYSGTDSSLDSDSWEKDVVATDSDQPPQVTLPSDKKPPLDEDWDKWE